MRSIVFLIIIAAFIGCSSSRVKTAATPTKVQNATFSPQKLTSTSWKIIKLESSDRIVEVPKEVAATLTFDGKQSRISGRCCNSYFGSYVLDSNLVAFSKLGATKMLCGGIEGEMETLYFKILSSSSIAISFADDKMIFHSNKGTITFAPLVKE
jgi:Heat shock protein